MIGEALGNYRILTELGRGSMGVVFLAEHQRIARRAAIKVLIPELSQKPDLLQRFFNEARATSLIRHPGIVDVFDCDVDAHGRAFIVMEHLEGETLAERLRRDGTLAWRAACAVAGQVADPLALAHAKGIVHRDLKPENIFLVGDPAAPATGAIKVLDFGVAKLREGEMSAHLTIRGMLVGTPTYMAPEQCAGSEQVDPRADIYALGCILFEMLAGRPPFAAPQVQALMLAHMYRPVPSLATSGVEVPAWLDDLVTRMLAKDPGQRPSAMREIASALRDGAAPRPLAPTRATAGPRLRVQRARIGVAVAALLALAGGAWVGGALRRRVPRAHPTVSPPALAARPASSAPLPTQTLAPQTLVPDAATPGLSLEPAPRTTAAPVGERHRRKPERAARAQPSLVDTDGIIDL